MGGLPWNVGAASGQPGLNPSSGQNYLGQYDYNGESQDPALATGYYPTEAAAQSAWFQANPQYGQYASDPNATGPNLTQQQNQQSVPTQPQNPAIAGGYNPLQPGYLGTPPTLNATTAPGQTLSPQLMQSLGSGQTINSLVSANQPQFQQQDQQMMQMLATAGLAPSSTAGQTAFNNLAQQQLAGMDPSIAAAIQNSQGNQLNAGQFNAGNLQQAGQFNANAQNTASGQNLSNYLNQQLYNTNAYNTAGNNYFNAATGAYNNNANAFNALNQQGLSGATGLAGQTASTGGQMANTQQGNYGVYQSQPINYGAFSGGSGGSPSFGNPYQSGGYAPTGAGMNTADFQTGDTP